MSVWTQWAYGNPIHVQVQQDNPISVVRRGMHQLTRGSDACCALAPVLHDGESALASQFSIRFCEQNYALDRTV
jgi:hypothetical protein